MRACKGSRRRCDYPKARASHQAVGHRPFPACRDRRCLAVSSNERRQVVADTSAYTPRVVERSGPAIRAALLAHAPERCAQFEEEFRSALALAAENLDLSGPQEALTRWHALATVVANPLTDEECELLERTKVGDYTGLK